MEKSNRLDGIYPSRMTVGEKQRVLWLAERVLSEYVRRGDALRNPDDTKRYLQAKLGCAEREEMWLLLLDNRHRLIADERISIGTINGAEVHPREAVRCAMKHNAAALILAHNHPSGVAEPSHSDRTITERLVSALAYVDVRVLDHMVVGATEVVSMAELGMM